MSDSIAGIANLSPEEREFLLQRLRQKRKNASPTKIKPQSRDSHTFPLSFAQQRLWFLEQLEPGSPFYNQPAAVRLTGALNLAVLEQSFNEIVRRHEILRTTFFMVEGQPVQAIAPTLTLTLPVVDLQELPEVARREEVRRIVAEEARQPFNLAEGPLLRGTLLQLGEAEHILLFTTHHIICDGWSRGVLIRELAALYEVFSSGKPSPLPELPIQYADFAVWQRQWLQGEVLEAQLTYWKQQLAGSPPVLELPTDRPRPSVQTFQGATQSLMLPKDLTEALKDLSQQEDATLFMTLLAAFKTLLYRYTGQEDILVGTPIANRNRSEIERLIGFFVNTLVMRTDLGETPSFRELLSRVRKVALEAYARQDLPFEYLVDELQLERDLSHAPLFQVMFVFGNTPMSALELPDLTMSLLETDSGTAKFDLTLSMRENEQGLIGDLEYNTDLFDKSTIARMLTHFQTLLEGVVANPDQRLADLPLLTEAERQQLLVEWNDTQTDYPSEVCLHQLFEAQVERSPDAIAVVFEDQQLTYRELNQRANQLANYLQKLGVGPEVLVGICLERSLEMMVGLLGILKAGGAYVPLDPAYPQERLAFILEDAQLPVLLTQARLAETLPSHQTKEICLDTDWEAIASGQCKSNPIRSVTSNNIAYVIYTSGSTGKPKGVMNAHQGICNRLLWMQDAYQLTETDHVLQKTPFSFDVSVWEFFWPLLNGARLVVAQPAGHQDSTYLVKLIASQQITTLHFVPSMLQAFLEEEGIEVCDSLKRVICSGEALPFELQERFFARIDAELHNLYGPTEAAIDVTFWHCGPWSDSSTVPIGRPIANTQVYLLDAEGQPVPIGVPGELHIGGNQLARSYLNRPKLTAEKFIPNLFSTQPGARLYKTGDLARYHLDGTIEYLDRIDHQVKVRGFRIELGEIEAMLAQHSQLLQTAVIAQEYQPGNKRLVGYVVPRQERVPSTSDLRCFLKEKLPEYMVPSAFVLLEALPLTPSGKVDRRALPAPDTARPELEKAFIAPRNPVEERIARIWTQVLQLESVGVYDNFFELGGDSILALQIIAKAHQAGLQLTLKHLFQHQTIAELTAVAGTTLTKEAEQEPVMGLLPLTPLQHWFFEQNLPEPHHWNQSVILKVRQALDLAFLEQVVQKLLEHHDALRLRFEQTEFGWQQVNAGPEETVPLTWLDLSMLSEKTQDSAISAAATALQTTLNFSSGPLVRVAVFDLGKGRPSRLLLIVHHLAVDGVSWRILLSDFQTAYQQVSQRKVIQLPPKTTSFKQWAERLRKYAHSAALQQELEYWLAKPRQQPVPIPVDFPGGNNTIAEASTISVALSVEETKALLREVPKAYQTQINEVLLTALVRAFEQWTGNRSLLVDLEGHGREEIFNDLNLSRTVGWFTTIFPVLLDLGEASGLGEALKVIKEQLRSVPNRGIGYGILRYLGSEIAQQQLQALPQAEIRFNYLGQSDEVFSSSSMFAPAPVSSGLACSSRGNRSSVLDINGIVVKGQLRLDWTYSKVLHRQATVETFAQSFLGELRELIAHCVSPETGGYTPSDFPQAQLSQQELDEFLAEL